MTIPSATLSCLKCGHSKLCQLKTHKRLSIAHSKPPDRCIPTRYHPKMKMLPLLRPVLILPLLLGACAENEASGGRTGSRREPSRAERHRESAARNQEEGSRPPRIGMTKDQVINMYGEPTNVSSSSRGETWFYVFNNFDGRAFIPYYGAVHEALKRRHSGSITFDGSGRVKDFEWNESNPRGATIWR